jgi:hypothetical protein
VRRTLFRLFAIAVLAVSLPLQGMASVAAGQCMAAGHHHDAGDQDHAAHPHSDHGGDKQQGEKHAHCGPCAACCASASIAGQVALLLLPSASNTKYLFSPLPPLAVEPDGFDRPPLAL